jgi:uncharacterized membrane protein HdeD (DUF308 family)
MFTPILEHVSRNWWMLALRGVAAIVFAFFAYFWPGLTLFALVILFGVYALADGIMATVVGARAHWWTVMVFGLIGIAAGLVAIFRPGLTALALLLFIAGWAVARGILEIVAAIRLRKEITNEWWLGLAGLLSIAFGVAMFLYPGAGALSLLWVIATYALILGAMMLAFAFRLRGMGQHQMQPPRREGWNPV